MCRRQPPTRLTRSSFMFMRAFQNVQKENWLIGQLACVTNYPGALCIRHILCIRVELETLKSLPKMEIYALLSWALLTWAQKGRKHCLLLFSVKMLLFSGMIPEMRSSHCRSQRWRPWLLWDWHQDGVGPHVYGRHILKKKIGSNCSFLAWLVFQAFCFHKRQHIGRMLKKESSPQSEAQIVVFHWNVSQFHIKRLYTIWKLTFVKFLGTFFN